MCEARYTRTMNETKQPKSRSGRAIKLHCVAGGDYHVSTSKRQLILYGPPSCPCHNTPMEEV
ncbi:hypothetical protein SEA_ALBRIGHT_45 [Microbacterium phage Albright]|uniref:hypothetical protein n=2 Tax=unclassified Dismasvirus TaxID=2562666 RepID=UPI001BB77485|nr:hypothetical protein QDW28_gp45 [Microbacterium phage Albright]QTF82220.1 hypothetical protein SEA_ALBRIGHT_45 [Microbacterium phage Albright]